MSKYNTGKKYNYTTPTGGTKYNSSQFVVLVNIYETIKASDSIKDITVKNILYEKANVFDDLTQYALHEFSDAFSTADKSAQFALQPFLEKFRLKDKYSGMSTVIPVREHHGVKDRPTQYAENNLKEKFSSSDLCKSSALQVIAERLGIKEILDDIIVSLYLHDNIKALDEIRKLNTFFSLNEEFSSADGIPSLEALANVAEKLGLKEFARGVNEIRVFEYTKATDRKPRKAISDFIIGQVDGKNNATEWFAPLGMIYDPERSDIQVMPQTESTYIEMPNVDGSIIEDTVYQNRLFNIVLWSEDGLSVAEKEQLKLDIARLLDSTKHDTKKLTYQKAGIAFDAKYSGKADIKEGPSFVKATIPFETQPYGYPLFDQIVYGSGLLVNSGDKEIGVVNEISGGCANPSFQIGDIVYKWDGTVPIDSKLVVDHSNMSCYLERNDGFRTNAMPEFTGEFQLLDKGKTIQITAMYGTEKYLRTIVKEKILWSR